MVVIVLSAAPAGLRGALTRWLLEVSTGVFVGHLSARVRDQVWELIAENLGAGRALLIYPVRSEQRYAILSLGHDRMPLDVEGLLVMQSPNKVSESAGRSGEGAQLSAPGVSTPRKEPWAIAARGRRVGKSRRR